MSIIRIVIDIPSSCSIYKNVFAKITCLFFILSIQQLNFCLKQFVILAKIETMIIFRLHFLSVQVLLAVFENRTQPFGSIELIKTLCEIRCVSWNINIKWYIEI